MDAKKTMKKEGKETRGVKGCPEGFRAEETDSVVRNRLGGYRGNVILVKGRAYNYNANGWDTEKGYYDRETGEPLTLAILGVKICLKED